MGGKEGFDVCAGLFRRRGKRKIIGLWRWDGFEWDGKAMDG